MTKNKITITIISVILIGVIFLTVGYSALNSTLNIHGAVSIGGGSSIYIKSIKNVVSTDEALENYNPIINETTFTVDTILPNYTSKMDYYLEVYNDTSELYQFDGISTITSNNENAEYEFYGLEQGYTINSKSSATINIRVEYKESKEKLAPVNTNVGFTIKFNFSHYSASGVKYFEEYVEQDLIMDLEGYKPQDSDTTIIDTLGNKFTKNGDVYRNALTNSIEFDGSGDYLKATKSFIPSTGEFTLETYLETPAVFPSKFDYSIISQVSDESSSSGRFKFNIQCNPSGAIKIPTLLFFDHNTATNNTEFHNINSNMENSKQYSAQIVRKGEYLYLYGNGVLVAKEAFSSQAKLSTEILKISKFTNSDPQYFPGKIFSARIYDRALDADELKSNFISDRSNYSYESDASAKNIKDYAIAYTHTTSGSGLYSEANNLLVYEGPTPNNYCKLNGVDFRIISFSPKGTMRLVDVGDPLVKIAFDTENTRDAEKDTYCQSYVTKGCNAWTSYESLTSGTYEGTVTTDATINKYLNTTWIAARSQSLQDAFLESSFNIGKIAKDIGINQAVSQSKAVTWKGKVGLMSVDEIVRTSLSRPTLSSTCTDSWFLNTATTSNAYYWTTNLVDGNDWDVWVYSNARQLTQRRASRIDQETLIFKANPVFEISSSYMVTGTGEERNPYIITT